MTSCNRQSSIHECDKKLKEIEINQIRIPKIINLFYLHSQSLIVGVLNEEWQSWNIVDGKLVLNQEFKKQLNLLNYKQHYCFLIEEKQTIIVCEFSQNLLIKYSTTNLHKLSQIQLRNGVTSQSQIYYIPENNQIFIISDYNHKLNLHQCSIHDINKPKRTLGYNIDNQIWMKPIIDKRFIIIREMNCSYIIYKQNSKIIRKINYRIESFDQRHIVTIHNQRIIIRDISSIKQKKEIKSIRKYQAITAPIINTYLIILYVKYIECFSMQNFELNHYSSVSQCVSKMAKFYYFSSYDNQLFIFIQHNCVEVNEMGKQVIYYF